MNSTRLTLFCAVAFAAVSPIEAAGVLDWNAAALTASRTDGDTSPEASRTLAILHAAIYDAVTGISGGYQPYQSTTPAPSGASMEAAAAAAARTVLSTLYPSMSSSFTSLYDSQVNPLASGQAVTDGINWGNAVATQLLTARDSDGANFAFGSVTPGDGGTAYTPAGFIGRWTTTPHSAVGWDYRTPPIMPGWGNVKQFTDASAAPLTGAPTLSSGEYANAYNEVMVWGGEDSTLRSTQQTQAAHFWNDYPGRTSTVAHWNEIASRSLVGASIETQVRVLAALNVAMADATIASWEAKYRITNGTTFDTWRPLSAIVDGASDGNAGTVGDIMAGTPLGWNSLLDAPTSPEYVSEVASASAAAGEVLKFYLGDIGISGDGDINGDGLYDGVRNLGLISDAVNEASDSGVWGGIAFRYSIDDGRVVGSTIGAYTAGNYFLSLGAVPEPSSALLIGLGLMSCWRRRR